MWLFYTETERLLCEIDLHYRGNRRTWQVKSCSLLAWQMYQCFLKWPVWLLICSKRFCLQTISSFRQASNILGQKPRKTEGRGDEKEFWFTRMPQGLLVDLNASSLQYFFSASRFTLQRLQSDCWYIHDVLDSVRRPRNAHFEHSFMLSIASDATAETL